MIDVGFKLLFVMAEIKDDIKDLILKSYIGGILHERHINITHFGENRIFYTNAILAILYCKL